MSIKDHNPFGMIMPGRNFNASSYRFGFGGHEKDDEIKGSGNHLSFGDYGYDTRLGRRWQLDPEPIIGISGYSAFNDNPILHADPDGKFPIIPIIAAAYYVASKIMEKSEGNEDVRAIGYSMRHPVNAFKVNGPFITNHNDIATNFQVNIGKAIGQPRNPDGGAQNAIRHTLWQAIETRDLGAKAASRVGNAHKKTTNVDLNQRQFGSLEDADRTIDLLNNKIGRSIGEQNKDADNKTITKSVVGEYYKNGLWTASGNAKDGFTIQKTKLTMDQYNAAIKEIDKKGQDGLNIKTDENK
jgi:hypothetical protein